MKLQADKLWLDAIRSHHHYSTVRFVQDASLWAPNPLRSNTSECKLRCCDMLKSRRVSINAGANFYNLQCKYGEAEPLAASVCTPYCRYNELVPPLCRSTNRGGMKFGTENRRPGRCSPTLASNTCPRILFVRLPECTGV
ncbi:hypothetical protein BKA67DRAFT_296831 [Truncatella angustata]|uniref:Uncharacterized protein n=1 Tax=Truncatella angustata TaxID=152316 RepID=A0A9P8ZVJ1_9PEZI|nr:uncharacterized protein BKA67DRAFT_296831 [Truncatella angustata]KAH6652665.1 hypothetical protein BKA67DRAFT_296831 [Truncatella angustata]